MVVNCKIKFRCLVEKKAFDWKWCNRVDYSLKAITNINTILLIIMNNRLCHYLFVDVSEYDRYTQMNSIVYIFSDLFIKSYYLRILLTVYLGNYFHS